MLLDFHIEFPAGTDLKTAHDAAEIIEEKIKTQLPGVSRSTIHLEVERSDRAIHPIRDVTNAQGELVAAITHYAQAANPAVRDVRDLILIASENHDLKLIITLLLDDSISLEAAHEVVTHVEDELRKRFPELVRIVAHSEPISR